jgi:hypothetical protein
VPLICDLAHETGFANCVSSVAISSTLLVSLDRETSPYDASSATIGLAACKPALVSECEESCTAMLGRADSVSCSNQLLTGTVCLP